MTRERLTIQPCPDGIADCGALSVDNPTAPRFDVPRGAHSHRFARPLPLIVSVLAFKEPAIDV